MSGIQGSRTLLLTTLLITMLTTMLGGANLAQAADPYRHNPFQRSAAPPETSPNSSAGSTIISYQSSHPRLRAVLNANAGSLANLDGHVLAQGESALGYTLVTVADHSAKFRFRQHIITLQVTEDRP